MKGHQYVLVSSVVIFFFQPALNLSVLGSHQLNTESEVSLNDVIYLISIKEKQDRAKDRTLWDAVYEISIC